MGIEVSFYHLERQNVEVALPKLLEKVLSAGHRAAVFLPDDAAVKALDEALWTYDPASFLPHGSTDTPHPELQPVYLTSGQDVPNGADIAVQINAASAPALSAFKRCLYMFDGRDEAILGQARADWKSLKDDGHSVTYWQQGQSGGWEKKA